MRFGARFLRTGKLIRAIARVQHTSCVSFGRENYWIRFQRRILEYCIKNKPGYGYLRREKEKIRPSYTPIVIVYTS